MTAPLARQYADGSKADTANGVNVANFLLGTGNLYDCIQTLGVGLTALAAGTANLTQANAGLVLIDATAGNVVINLPACSAAIGALFQFKRSDATTNTVTINRAGADTIDGITFLSLLAQYEFQEIRSDGVSIWRLLNTLANAARARALLGINSLAGGQCQLSLAAGSLKLLPKNGNVLIVNGIGCTVPDAGVTLAATGLLATTLYYIYAVATAGVITSLEASSSAGHAPDSALLNKGIEVKSSDPTRSFVGLAYCKVAATFADTSTQRFVRSWFNDFGTAGSNQLGTNTSFGSVPFIEVTTAMRCEFVLFAREILCGNGGHSAFDSGGGSGSMYCALGYDATPCGRTGVSYGAAGVYHSASAGYTVDGLTEGYHYQYFLGGISGGATPAYLAPYTGHEFHTTRR